MGSTQQTRDLKYEDPLFARVKKTEKRDVVDKAGNGGMWRMWGPVVLVAGLGFLAYFLFQNQKEINQLHANLAESQSELEGVNSQLETSGEEIVELRGGLTRNQSQLKSQARQLKQYGELYKGVKSEQQQQTRELRAMALEKADRSWVDSLESETAGIKEDLQTVDKQVSQANSAISDLRQTTTENRTGVTANRDGLATVRQTAEGTAQELSRFQQSLERDYYNFEVPKKAGGFIKVFDVTLRLRKTDVKKQRYELDIYLGKERIKKKDRYINEPIYFYQEGLKKPYEVVVTKVNKEYVVGYLSVPKG